MMLRHRIHQRADAVDGYADNVAALQGEFISGDDAGASHEKGAGGKGVVTEEKACEFGGRTLKLRHRRFAFEGSDSRTVDLQMNAC